MATRMLIDAAHPEETRVVVVKGTRLDEFDLESSTKAQLKGNIYLAKVTRVEPALQAAFVDYGGNRHGFLAFNEIHPDYYQIPVADKRALVEAESREPVDDDGDEDAESDTPKATDSQSTGDDADSSSSAEVDTSASGDESADDDEPVQENIEAVGGDEIDEVRAQRSSLLRSYRIQEVIKRRQIILVQVVKEERGNKGAALTTYISLAGRYCVLMPNTGRGGGISRKITNANDRRRLKSIVNDLEIPEGMALIVRTAGAQRSKAEIRRDYDYLYRLWDDVREKTLQSRAPALVHEEASLIKRSIRDLYNKDIDEVLIDGEEGYKTAKSFMRMLMPSHAKRVQRFRDEAPLFHKYRIDEQLDSMMSPEVQLKSGGYIVLGPTEALVAIDVNSGRATRERNIEETALKTNLEAAEEIARQLRLRDLAGLIVIDFIDMELPRNNRAVERKLKECLKSDRARIQVGRISHFGLLEMSRQRLRPSLLEASTDECPTCLGTGLVRSTESAALYAVRAMEDEAIRGKSAAFRISVATPVAIYLLNEKRATIGSIEARHDTRISVAADDSLISPQTRLEQLEPSTPLKSKARKDVQSEEDDKPEEEPAVEAVADEDQEDRPRRKRRRGKRGGRRRAHKDQPTEVQADSGDDKEMAEPAREGSEEVAREGDAASSAETGETRSRPKDGGEDSQSNDDATAPKRPRRRRSRRRKQPAASSDGDASNSAEATSDEDKAKSEEPVPVEAAADTQESVAADQNEGRSTEVPVGKAKETTQTDEPVVAAPPSEDEPSRPARRRRTRKPRAPKSEPTDAEPQQTADSVDKPAGDPDVQVEVATKASAAPEGLTGDAPPEEEKGPPKRGWWRREG